MAGATALILSSCVNRDAPTSTTTDVVDAPSAQATRPAAAPIPQDSFQRDSQSVVGISYPVGLDRYPDLARVLVGYAHSQRAVLANALALNPNPAAPYELTLRFSTSADSPRLYAVRADQELFTGGATSRPRKAAFMWLPDRQHLLKSDELIADPAGWALARQAIQDAGHATSGVAEGALPPLVPLLNSSGQITALTFLLEDGDVLVPAASLRRYAAPEYRSWFASDPTG